MRNCAQISPILRTRTLKSCQIDPVQVPLWEACLLISHGREGLMIAQILRQN